MHKMLLLALLPLAACSADGMNDVSRSSTGAVMIDKDMGGLLNQRADRISELRKQGARVEIRGRCISSCTMFLELDNVCVHPGATLEFHGPSYLGIPMGPKEFEISSQFMARSYPAPIRDWYLRVGRYTQGEEFWVMTGVEAMKFGIKPC